MWLDIELSMLNIYYLDLICTCLALVWYIRGGIIWYKPLVAYKLQKWAYSTRAVDVQHMYSRIVRCTIIASIALTELDIWHCSKLYTCEAKKVGAYEFWWRIEIYVLFVMVSRGDAYGLRFSVRYISRYFFFNFRKVSTVQICVEIPHEL